MKKLFVIIGLCCALVLSGCQVTVTPNPTQTASATSVGTDDSQSPTPVDTATPTPSQTATSNLKASDFYPFNANKKYTYQGDGNEYASYTVYTDYTTANRVQFRIDNGGTETVKVLEVSNGEVKQLISQSECYYRENFTTTKITTGDVLLKEPLVAGTTWKLADGSTRTITNTSASITTPIGTYTTIAVTTTGKNGTTVDYYAKNIGLVKTVYTSGGSEISSTLSKIDNNVKLTQSIKFYYPNINDDKIHYVTKKISFSTNDITRIMIQNAYKNVPSGVGGVLTTNTKINWLFLSKGTVVYVDLSKEFLTEMNAGSGYESMILQSITNTLGVYYGVNQVYLTVNNSPYSSGHIYMEKGETFKVNLKNVVSND